MDGDGRASNATQESRPVKLEASAANHVMQGMAVAEGAIQEMQGLVPEHLVALQAEDECLEALGDGRDLVAPFLVDVDDLRLSTRSALAVIEADHVVPGGWAVGEVDPDRWVPPLTDPESAPQATAKREGFLTTNREYPSDGYVVARPRGPLFGPVAGLPRYPTVLAPHERDIGRGQCVAQFVFDRSHIFVR